MNKSSWLTKIVWGMNLGLFGVDLIFKMIEDNPILRDIFKLKK